jgi:hypothetical protein
MSEPPKKPAVDVSKLTDFEISMLIVDRDVSQYRVERIDELLNEVGQARGFAEAGKKESGPPAAVKEETFTILKFEAQKGARIGDFEVASKANNLPDKWQPAYNILRQNNSTIKDRYHGPGYAYSYWIYGEDRIYRQRLK